MIKLIHSFFNFFSVFCCVNGDTGKPPKNLRQVRGNKAAAIMKATKAKVPLDYSIFKKRPSSQCTSNMAVRDIGNIVRTHVPMVASTYAKLPKHLKEIVLTNMKVITF